MTQEVCLFCDNTKDKNQIIEGMNGFICKDCLTVCQALTDETVDSIERPEGTERMDIKQLKAYVDTYVVGQDESKKQLITEIYKHYTHSYTTKNNILLIGNSGVGKTHLMRTLAEGLDVPFLEVDATAYTETGYKGRDVTEMLDDLVIQTNGDTEQMKRAIVFIDEIDKITSTQSREPSTKVQHALLKIIEGTTYHYKVGQGQQTLAGTLDTSDVLFIGAGACDGLDDIRDERQRPQRAIGFRQELSNSAEPHDYSSDDLIQFGFIPELVGRFSLVLEMKPLSEENIRELLVNHPNSPIAEMTQLCHKENIQLTVNDATIEWLVAQSINSPLGVRSVAHAINKRLNAYLFDALMEERSSIALGDVLDIPPQTVIEKEL